MAAMAMLHSEELTTCLLLPRIPAAAPRSQPGSLALQPLDTKMSFQSTICRMSSSDRGSNGSEVCWYTTGSATNSCWHSQIESKLCLACCGERLMPGVPPGRPAWAKPLERPALWGSICEPSRIHGYWWSQKARWFYSFTSLAGTFLRGNHSASCVFTVNYMLWRGKREQDRQTDRLGKKTKQNKTPTTNTRVVSVQTIPFTATFAAPFAEGIPLLSGCAEGVKNSEPESLSTA